MLVLLLVAAVTLVAQLMTEKSRNGRRQFQATDYRASVARICDEANLANEPYNLKVNVSKILSGETAVSVPKAGYWVLEECEVAGNTSLTRLLWESAASNRVEVQKRFDRMFNLESVGLPVTVDPQSIRPIGRYRDAPEGVL